MADKPMTADDIRNLILTEVESRVASKTADTSAKLKALEEENKSLKAAGELRTKKDEARAALSKHQAAPALAKWLAEDKDSVLADLDERVEAGSMDPVGDLAKDYDKWAKKWAKYLGVAEAAPAKPEDKAAGSGDIAAAAAALAAGEAGQASGYTELPTIPLTQMMMDLNRKHGIA